MKKKLSSLLIITLLSSLNCVFAQLVGINTTTPKSTLDVNGDLTVRSTPDFVNGSLYSIGIDNDGKVVKKNLSSFNKYLGFAPMASSHSVSLPFVLEDGYIIKIIGTSIGASGGIMVNFEISFLGKTYLGAKLQPIATTGSTIYPEVTLNSTQSVFSGKSLEVLANAGSSSSSVYGHTLSYNSTTGIITDTFNDTTPYYPNAGTFIIYSFEKYKRN